MNARLKENGLLVAVVSASFDSVKKLLVNGADLICFDEKYRSPLHWAANLGRVDVCKLLLEYEAEVNILDINHETPLYRAVATNNVEVVKLLLSHDADVAIPSLTKKTCLHLACLEGHEDLLELICGANGVNLNAQDEEGFTALHYACFNKNKRCVARLLEQEGIEINTIDNEGNTCLFHCIDDFEIVCCLLEHSIDTNKRNKENFLAVDYCTDETIRSILSNDVEVSVFCDKTDFGDQVVICGEFCNWQLSKAVSLDGSTFPQWKGTISVPIEEFEYKFVIRKVHGYDVWESGDNKKCHKFIKDFFNF